MTFPMTREERLNNPGGIKRVPGVTWVGQTDDQPDKLFVQFSTPQYGIRAIAHTLRTYWLKDGVTTVAQAITRWAPPAENYTQAYINAVCPECGVEPDEPVELPVILFPLVRAIINHENGAVIYTDEVIQQGIALP